MTEWTIVVDSDQHYDEVGNSGKSPVNRSSLLPKADIVICPGDLTSTAAQSGCCWWLKNKKVQSAAVQHFISKYAAALEIKGVLLKLCAGNHDNNSSTNELLKAKYGGTEYVFDYNGVRFICLGPFPKDLTFLNAVLTKTDKQMPIVIFYHFNTIPGEPFSDWWSQEQKDAFYAAIKSYRIDAILNGHWHTSVIERWNGIVCAIAGGSRVVVLRYKGNSLQTTSLELVPPA